LYGIEMSLIFGVWIFELVQRAAVVRQELSKLKKSA